MKEGQKNLVAGERKECLAVISTLEYLVLGNVVFLLAPSIRAKDQETSAVYKKCPVQSTAMSNEMDHKERKLYQQSANRFSIKCPDLNLPCAKAMTTTAMRGL